MRRNRVLIPETRPNVSPRPITSLLFLLLAFTQVSAQTGAVPVSRGPADTVRLTIEEAHAAALRANPELTAATLDIDVARGELRQAGIVRFNPVGDVLGFGTSSTMSEVSLGQEVEIAGQRGVRRAVARAGVSRAAAGVADVARATIVDVTRSFYRSLTADRRADLALEVLALNERLAQVAIRQLREGEISKLDYNLSMVERGRAQARAYAARREQHQTLIELRRLVGLAPGTPVRVVFDSSVHRHATIDSTGVLHTDLSAFGAQGDTSAAQLTTRALERRPDLAERNAAVVQAERDIALARREAVPNLVARAVSEQNDAGTGRMLRPGIGVSIPIFNRNQGDIEARRALARQATLGRAATAARVRAEVESSLRAYEAAAGELEVLENTVLGPARENRRLLEAAYREGKVGLPVLLLIRNQVIDAEQEYWTAWLAEREAAAELTAAVGGSPSPVSPR